jgi:hypothetical protein
MERSRKAAIEADMIDSVIFSLIYGPVAITLACWLFFTIEVGRAKKDVVVSILTQKRRRFYPGRPGC